MIVQVGTSCWESQRLHAGAFQNPPELLGEQWGSVVDQELGSPQKAVTRVGQIARHLQHPRFPEFGDDAGNSDLSRHEPDDKEHVIPD